ncbi:hypothetical protein FALBO_11673 [Fusarium albosuccineum]|uniref:Ubiquitin 3 binding protein But2 C-terminal domain-containing protein n=1 Tax=Fusarium albosuccineum TaxID=1237068 RepID=A0A8H4L5G8_9HYPO|nr:hypothetical protein FALBO_11673 [Fusarium albosuccineum]
MPSLASVICSLACLLAVADARPAVVPRAGTRLEPSGLYNIFPESPDLSKDSLGFHLETYNNASQVEQVLVFSGIPAGAKTCSVGWDQGERIERVFIVKGGNALAGVKQLSGFPDNEVTYNTIKPFADGEEFGGADFTNWDDLPAQGHNIGSVDCAETLYLKVALRDKNGNTKVFLNQDKTNGLAITYS